MTATRRLAAILAVDVVGYSRLMGEDEAGTFRSVQEHREAARPIVMEFGGRLVKTMGDGLLLEFPSIVAAVECAVRIQHMMLERNQGVRDDRKIIYRMGIHIGDVLIEADDIYGEGGNIAARLEATAAPGGSCISGPVHEHVRGRVDVRFFDLGEKVLKNTAHPVRIFSTVEAAPAQNDSVRGADDTPRLSIVVLPFANIGGDASQDYFVDGVTEILTTDLSRIRGSFVISRSTAFSYKGKA